MTLLNRLREPLSQLFRFENQLKSPSIPRRLQDFVMNSKVKFGMENFVGYSNLSLENQAFDFSLNKSIEPTSYSQAKHDTHWVDAMNEEMEALNRNHTWDLVDFPKGRRTIGCKGSTKPNTNPLVRLRNTKLD
jgi:hypothetical protein